MKHFIIDFEGVRFDGFKVHGGGDFALRLVGFFKDQGVGVSIINNVTPHFPDNTIHSQRLNEMMTKGGELIYFNPLYTGKSPMVSNHYTRKYVYIHGLRMLEMPFDKYSFKYFKGLKGFWVLLKSRLLHRYYFKKEIALLNGVDSGSVILTPSVHSKYMMQAHSDRQRQIDVIPPFLNSECIESSEKLPIESSYVLFLNGDRWVKNSYRFLKAFSELAREGKLGNLKVVVVGKPVFANEFSDCAIFLDYVKRDYLETLMKGCEYLAYPSLNEGFGYPPIDCMKYGKPVLCTSLSAPNQVYNGMVVFVNPFSIAEIKGRILYIKNLCDKNQTAATVLMDRYKLMSQEVLEAWTSFIKLSYE